MAIDRIVFLSDLHEQWDKVVVPDGDLLVFGGDFSYRGELSVLGQFNRWLGKLPHRHKVGVAGNHDWCFQRMNSLARATLNNMVYLEDSEVTIEGIRIYGSPWTPTFCNWAFMKDRGAPIRARWEQIPESLDILITHGPPYKILDGCDDGHVGCGDLLNRVLKVKPKIHTFGHVHEGYGEHFQDGITFINASNLDGHYRTVNAPIVVKWSDYC